MIRLGSSGPFEPTRINWLLSGSGIALTNSEMGGNIKVIRSLENGGILLKESNKKIISQIGRLVNFLRPLMSGGLPLMKNVFRLQVKLFCYH